MIIKKITYTILVVFFAALVLVAWIAVLGPSQVSGSDCDSQSVGCPAESDNGNTTNLVSGYVLTPTTFLPMINKPCPVLFSDSFDDPNSGWPQWETNNTLGEYENGHYRVFMKKAGYWVASAPDKFYGSAGYKVSAEAKNQNGIDGSYGLIFDVNGDGSNSWFKTFEIMPDGSYSIWQYDTRTNPNWNLLASGFSSHINKGANNNLLSIRWHDKSIVAYANGQMIDLVNLSSMQSSSAVGIYVSSPDVPKLEVLFDNYVVESANCGPQPLAPVSSPAKFGQGSPVKILTRELMSGDDIRGR